MLWVRLLLGRMGALVRSVVRTVGVGAKVLTERTLGIGIVMAAWGHGARILGPRRGLVISSIVVTVGHRTVDRWQRGHHRHDRIRNGNRGVIVGEAWGSG